MLLELWGGEAPRCPVSRGGNGLVPPAFLLMLRLLKHISNTNWSRLAAGRRASLVTGWLAHHLALRFREASSRRPPQQPVSWMFIPLAGWTSDLFPREILVLALPNTFAREKLNPEACWGCWWQRKDHSGVQGVSRVNIPVRWLSQRLPWRSPECQGTKQSSWVLAPENSSDSSEKCSMSMTP